MKMQNSSPSNIKTGWNQKYFYSVEKDSMLDTIVKIFTKHGNSWSMKRDLFEDIITKKRLDECFTFAPVCEEVLEVEGDAIRFQEYVAENLLANSWRWSPKNTLKNLKKSAFVEMCIDAWAFIVDPEARTASEFKYTNGNPMSIRCAKKIGHIK